VPIILFLFLDSYYLSLERQFRTVYNDFIKKLHYGGATVDDIFLVTPRTGSGATSLNIIKASCSIAVWLFYALLAVMLLIVRAWIL